PASKLFLLPLRRALRHGVLPVRSFEELEGDPACGYQLLTCLNSHHPGELRLGLSSLSPALARRRRGGRVRIFRDGETGSGTEVRRGDRAGSRAAVGRPESAVRRTDRGPPPPPEGRSVRDSAMMPTAPFPAEPAPTAEGLEAAPAGRSAAPALLIGLLGGIEPTAAHLAFRSR
ncbi:MAG: hypothetical protein ACREC5_07405, partial [Thermoplasmata archaeon]